MILLCFGVVQKTLTIADLNTLRCWGVRAVRSRYFTSTYDTYVLATEQPGKRTAAPVK